jgi:hypothetical protein
MKFVTTWTARTHGGAAEEAAKRGLELFGKWSPPEDVTFLQFVTRLDGNGGFAVLETDNPANLGEAAAKFGPYFEFHIYPVLDIAEGAALGSDGVAWRDSI